MMMMMMTMMTTMMMQKKKCRMYTIPSSYCYNKVCMCCVMLIRWNEIYMEVLLRIHVFWLWHRTAGKIILNIFDGSFTFKSKQPKTTYPWRCRHLNIGLFDVITSFSAVHFQLDYCAPCYAQPLLADRNALQRYSYSVTTLQCYSFSVFSS